MTDVAPHIDLLTGAFKRSHFERLLTELCSQTRRGGGLLSLIYFDIDECQELNDLHGKDRVDAALAWVASMISQTLDGLGPIGRVGGDEFAVALKVPPEHAMRLAQRLRQAVSRELHASAFGDFRLTVSAGIVALRPKELPGNLLDAGEEACTRAKQQGRDAVATR
jgi:diguanylate cyclase (GGDEF)-like protein